MELAVIVNSKNKSVRTYHFRITSQIFFAFVAILGVVGVGMTGFIYPFFFCPASPGACAGCPIWVIEHGTLEVVSGAWNGYLMILYLIGMFLVLGALVGRAFCGWACPVGSLQDLFAFLSKKLGSLKVLSIFSAISFTMLLTGAILPTVLRDAGVELQYYMFVGYIGALGSFLLALSGILFIKRYGSPVPSLVLIFLGTVPWVLVLLSEDVGLDETPAGSLELMGLFGLMFQVIGLIGIIRWALGDKVPRLRPMKGIDRWARLGKVGLLLLIAPTSWFFDTLFFTDFDPIGGITATIPELLLNPTGWAGNQFFWYKAVFVVGVIVLVSFVDRGWCRYLCPIGAMYGPTNKISVSDIHFKKDQCIHCQLCIRACPMDINPKENKTDPECIRCGRCSEVCPVDAQVWTPVNSTLRGWFEK
jgi:polyferredoxin